MQWIDYCCIEIIRRLYASGHTAFQVHNQSRQHSKGPVEAFQKEEKPPPDVCGEKYGYFNVTGAADVARERDVGRFLFLFHIFIKCRGPPLHLTQKSGALEEKNMALKKSGVLIASVRCKEIKRDCSAPNAHWFHWANSPSLIGERSERGQATASAGMEGGENLELSPSQKTSIRYQFEVYCKKVIRGERCDYLRQVLRLADREICFSDLPFDSLLRIGMLDDYPSSHYVFETLGQQISVEDDRLGEALSQIEVMGRDILLLAYFLDLKDREIGMLLGIPRSTIQRRRQQFLDQMKQLMKE